MGILRTLLSSAPWIVLANPGAHKLPPPQEWALWIAVKKARTIFVWRGLWCWENRASFFGYVARLAIGNRRGALPFVTAPLGPFLALSRRMGFYGRWRREPAGRRIAGVDVRFLDDLGIADKVVPPAFKALTADSDMRFLLDISVESLEPLAENPKRLSVINDLIEKAGISVENVALLNTNAASRRYREQWRSSNNDRPCVHLLGYHFHFFNLNFLMQNNPWFKRHGNRLKEIAYQAVSEGVRRPHRFMCLNLKDRPHRFALLLHLLDRGHTKCGAITYYGEGDRTDAPNDSQIAFMRSLPSADRLEPHIPDLRRLRPITLKDGAQDVRTEAWSYTMDGSFSWMIPELRLQNDELTHLLSYFEIVTETYFSRDDVLYLTEKTIRPLLRCQPFISIGPPHQLRELRRLGFKTFAPWINEAYDDIVDPALRMEAAFLEIDRLCMMPIDELHQVYCEMWPVLAHNFDRYTDYAVMRRMYQEQSADNVVEPLRAMLAN